MMLDVIAVIFIVALSFILCMKDGNNNCQISHIVIGLSVMVFYKLAKLLKLNQITKESFDTTSDLNAFISGNVVGNVVAAPNQLQTLSTTDLAAYNSKLDSLITAINNLYNQQNNPQPNLSVNPANIQKLDLESQQQYQMFQIDYLNKQLQNANYKPIKVYNSCVISNADGTTTIDTPVNSTKSSSTAFLQPSLPSNSSNLESGMNTYPITNRNDMTTINSAKSNNFVNLSPSTGAFGNLLNSLANGQGNININL